MDGTRLLAGGPDAGRVRRLPRGRFAAIAVVAVVCALCAGGCASDNLVTLERQTRYQFPVGQSTPFATAAPAARPALRIYYCSRGSQSRDLITDYKTDAAFRATIDARYAIEWIDHDQHPILAALNGAAVRTPYFYVPCADIRFSCYTGKAWLLYKLQLGPLPTQNADNAPQSPDGGVSPAPATPSSGNSSASPSGEPSATAPGLSSTQAPPPSGPFLASGSVNGSASGPFAASQPVDLLNDIGRQISELKTGLAALRKGQITLGQSDPMLSLILAKLGDLDDLQKAVAGLHAKIPQPVDLLLQKGATDAANKVLPGFLEQIATKLGPLLGASGAAGAAGGLPGILATIGATVGLGPIGPAVGLGMALLGVVQLVWKKLSGSGSIKLPAPLQQLASLAPSLLAALRSAGPSLPQVNAAPSPTVVAQPQAAPYPVDAMATAYQAAYQQFIKGNPDNGTISVLANFDNLVQQHLNARSTQ